MIRIIIVLTLFPLVSKAQIKLKAGINFRQGLSWEDIKEIAVQEKKNIFVDCYATWCRPCKNMDKYVFSNDTVGEYMNSRFVSIKLQMDTSSNDDSDVKMLYVTSHEFKEIYKVFAMPTYLFFSPDGKIMHKAIGALDSQRFMSLVTDVVDPHKQMYTLYNSFKSSALSYSLMPDLANILKANGEDSIALEVARHYMHEYLDKQPDEIFYAKDNLEFLKGFYKMISVDDKFFNFCYKQGRKVDSVLWNGAADALANAIISNNVIMPLVNKDNVEGISPRWKRISNIIKHKYGLQYATTNIVSVQIRWYFDRKDWKNYSKYVVQSVKLKLNGNGNANMSGLGNIIYFNNNAYEVFKYSNSRKELKQALAWIERVFFMDPRKGDLAGLIDTQANILYKLGNVQEAIKLESSAVELSPKAKEWKDVLDKMKRGVPTWPIL